MRWAGSQRILEVPPHVAGALQGPGGADPRGDRRVPGGAQRHPGQAQKPTHRDAELDARDELGHARADARLLQPEPLELPGHVVAQVGRIRSVLGHIPEQLELASSAGGRRRAHALILHGPTEVRLAPGQAPQKDPQPFHHASGEAVERSDAKADRRAGQPLVDQPLLHGRPVPPGGVYRFGLAGEGIHLEPDQRRRPGDGDQRLGSCHDPTGPDGGAHASLHVERQIGGDELTHVVRTKGADLHALGEGRGRHAGQRDHRAASERSAERLLLDRGQGGAPPTAEPVGGDEAHLGMRGHGQILHGEVQGGLGTSVTQSGGDDREPRTVVPGDHLRGLCQRLGGPPGLVEVVQTDGGAQPVAGVDGQLGEAPHGHGLLRQQRPLRPLGERSEGVGLSSQRLLGLPQHGYDASDGPHGDAGRSDMQQHQLSLGERRLVAQLGELQRHGVGPLSSGGPEPIHKGRGVDLSGLAAGAGEVHIHEDSREDHRAQREGREQLLEDLPLCQRRATEHQHGLVAEGDRGEDHAPLPVAVHHVPQGERLAHQPRRGHHGPQHLLGLRPDSGPERRRVGLGPHGDLHGVAQAGVDLGEALGRDERGGPAHRIEAHPLPVDQRLHEAVIAGCREQRRVLARVGEQRSRDLLDW